MRGAFGLHVEKQISPAFALGVEGLAGINTSSWYSDIHSKTAIDNTYVGAYGSVNLFNLFGGLRCDGVRIFDIDLVAGAGWGHNFNSPQAFAPYAYGVRDQNYFMTKAGLNFNFNLSSVFTLPLKPSVSWNMTGTEYTPLEVEYTSAA